MTLIVYSCDEVDNTVEGIIIVEGIIVVEGIIIIGGVGIAGDLLLPERHQCHSLCAEFVFSSSVREGSCVVRVRLPSRRERI